MLRGSTVRALTVLHFTIVLYILIYLLVQRLTRDDTMEQLTRNTNDVLFENQKVRQLAVRNFCFNQAFNVSMPEMYNPGLLHIYSDKQRVIYCPVPKATCTNWKRMFQAFDGNVRQPMELRDRQNVHKLLYNQLLDLPLKEQNIRKNRYYSFLFVRHPFERLYSAYRNKFLNPYDSAYQETFGSIILKMYRKGLTQKQFKEGKNVTFVEFINYIIHSYKLNGIKYFDPHWQTMNALCQPCSNKYDFIGKMETLYMDSIAVLEGLSLHKTLKFPINETDKYKIKTKSLIPKAFSQFSSSTMKKLYEIYSNDFEAFGYDPKLAGETMVKQNKHQNRGCRC